MAPVPIDLDASAPPLQHNVVIRLPGGRRGRGEEQDKKQKKKRRCPPKKEVMSVR